MSASKARTMGRRLAARRSLAVVSMILLLGMFPLIAERSQADEILGPFYQTVQLPVSGARTLGFRTSIRVPKQTSVGYVPVEITFFSATPTPADRLLVYRFETRPGFQTPPQNGLVINVPLAVPQGTTSKTWVRYLPKWSAGLGLEISVLEDSRPLPDYVDVIGRELGRGRNANVGQLEIEHQINWIYISPDKTIDSGNLPDLRSLMEESHMPPGQVGIPESKPTASMTFWAQLMKGPKALALGQEELPDDWRAYQRYDVVIMNAQGLERTINRRPQREALRSWVLHGGTIMVFGVRSRYITLDFLKFTDTHDRGSDDQIWGLANQMNLRIKAQIVVARDTVQRLEKVKQQRDRSSPEDSGRAETSFPSTNLSRLRSDGTLEGELKLANAQLRRLTALPQYGQSEWSKRIWTQFAGAGMVMGLDGDGDGDVPPEADWRIAFATIGVRASPLLRRGVDPMVGDRRFLRWLIPGVAEPPVYTFMGLLTAFVILVGPVAYRKTAKQSRSYLMFAIAPVLALATTVTMFGYGIVADGFGTTVRVRQLTWVDGKSGDAGERVRSTYFAGIRPSDDLKFPGDAEVIGYREGTGQSWEELSKLPPANLGNVTILRKSQRFAPSFLPSREQRQFVTHAPRSGVGFLRLRKQLGSGGGYKVTNLFDFALHESVMRDQSGKYWLVEDLAARETVTCTPLTDIEASQALGRLYQDHRPIASVQERNQRSNYRYRQEIFDVQASINGLLASSRMLTEGLFETWLQQHLQTEGGIPRDHFVAVADVSSDVVAVEGAELVASVRYVFGTLR